MEYFSNSELLDQVRQLGQQLLPSGSGLYLYGSRARGDANADSDWDFLLLLDKESATDEDYSNYAYPIQEIGFNHWQYFSIQMYTKSQWQKMNFTPYYKNVEQDKIVII